MLGELVQHIDPYQYNQILQIILGPDLSGNPQGQADANGNAGGFVGRVKRQNNDPSTTFREVRPLDSVIGGTLGQYSTTMTSGAVVTQVCGTTTVAAKVVPQGQGVLAFGWYLDGDLGSLGYLQVLVNNNLRQEVSAMEVFNDTFHFELMLSQIAYAAQGDTLAFQGLNNAAADVRCMAFPMAILIGPAAQLGFDTGAK
jgi:hypothetical protein